MKVSVVIAHILVFTFFCAVAIGPCLIGLFDYRVWVPMVIFGLQMRTAIRQAA